MNVREPIRRLESQDDDPTMNRLKKLLGDGSVAVGVQLRFGSPAIAELAGKAGFDWILLDTEHAPQTPPGVQAQLQAIGNSQATPIVRLGKNDPALIRLYLDMGAAGIAVPFISTAEEAKIGADASRYPPRGTRGWGPHRAATYGLEEEAYTTHANDDVMYIPIIETKQAVENIEAIMAVDGVDACIVGPFDLSFSLGIPKQFEHTDYLAAVERIREAAVSAGKSTSLSLRGAFDNRQGPTHHADPGAQLLLCGGDEPFLGQAFRESVRRYAHLKHKGGQT